MTSNWEVFEDIYTLFIFNTYHEEFEQTNTLFFFYAKDVYTKFVLYFLL